MTAAEAAPEPGAGGIDGAIKQKVARATFWAALETAGAQGAAFLFFVVFARLLSPTEFGVYALGMAIVGAVNMILFQGFGDGLIQAERLDDAATSTAFWTNMLLAAGMVAGLQVIAGFAVVLFHEPLLEPVIRWLSLLCIPRALVSVHSALFRRTLDLRIFAIRTILGSVAGGLVGVGLALTGFGVWALVISQFVQSALIAAIMWRSTAWRPRLLFSVPAFRALLGFSRHFMAASVISSCIDDLGSVLVGLNMDLVAVGYYAVGLRVIRALIILAMTPLQLVMMPALRRIAHDRTRFAAAYTEMVLMASTAWLPAAAGLGLAAPLLIPPVFGAQWVGAIPVVQAMSFVALTMPFWTFSWQALSALGHPDAFARMAYLAARPLLRGAAGGGPVRRRRRWLELGGAVGVDGADLLTCCGRPAAFPPVRCYPAATASRCAASPWRLPSCCCRPCCRRAYCPWQWRGWRAWRCSRRRWIACCCRAISHDWSRWRARPFPPSRLLPWRSHDPETHPLRLGRQPAARPPASQHRRVARLQPRF